MLNHSSQNKSKYSNDSLKEQYIQLQLRFLSLCKTYQLPKKYPQTIYQYIQSKNIINGNINKKINQNEQTNNPQLPSLSNKNITSYEMHSKILKRQISNILNQTTYPQQILSKLNQRSFYIQILKTTLLKKSNKNNKNQYIQKKSNHKVSVDLQLILNTLQTLRMLALQLIQLLIQWLLFIKQQNMAIIQKQDPFTTKILSIINTDTQFIKYTSLADIISFSNQYPDPLYSYILEYKVMSGSKAIKQFASVDFQMKRRIQIANDFLRYGKIHIQQNLEENEDHKNKYYSLDLDLSNEVLKPINIQKIAYKDESQEDIQKRYNNNQIKNIDNLRKKAIIKKNIIGHNYITNKHYSIQQNQKIALLSLDQLKQSYGIGQQLPFINQKNNKQKNQGKVQLQQQKLDKVHKNKKKQFFSFHNNKKYNSNDQIQQSQKNNTILKSLNISLQKIKADVHFNKQTLNTNHLINYPYLTHQEKLQYLRWKTQNKYNLQYFNKKNNHHYHKMEQIRNQQRYSKYYATLSPRYNGIDKFRSLNKHDKISKRAQKQRKSNLDNEQQSRSKQINKINTNINKKNIIQMKKSLSPINNQSEQTQHYYNNNSIIKANDKKNNKFNKNSYTNQQQKMQYKTIDLMGLRRKYNSNYNDGLQPQNGSQLAYQHINRQKYKDKRHYFQQNNELFQQYKYITSLNSKQSHRNKYSIPSVLKNRDFLSYFVNYNNKDKSRNQNKNINTSQRKIYKSKNIKQNQILTQNQLQNYEQLKYQQLREDNNNINNLQYIKEVETYQYYPNAKNINKTNRKKEQINKIIWMDKKIRSLQNTIENNNNNIAVNNNIINTCKNKIQIKKNKQKEQNFQQIQQKQQTLIQKQQHQEIIQKQIDHQENNSISQFNHQNKQIQNVSLKRQSIQQQDKSIQKNKFKKQDEQLQNTKNNQLNSKKNIKKQKKQQIQEKKQQIQKIQNGHIKQQQKQTQKQIKITQQKQEIQYDQSLNKNNNQNEQSNNESIQNNQIQQKQNQIYKQQQYQQIIFTQPSYTEKQLINFIQLHIPKSKQYIQKVYNQQSFSKSQLYTIVSYYKLSYKIAFISLIYQKINQNKRTLTIVYFNIIEKNSKKIIQQQFKINLFNQIIQYIFTKDNHSQIFFLYNKIQTQRQIQLDQNYNIISKSKYFKKHKKLKLAPQNFYNKCSILERKQIVYINQNKQNSYILSNQMIFIKSQNNIKNDQFQNKQKSKGKSLSQEINLFTTQKNFYDQNLSNRGSPKLKSFKSMIKINEYLYISLQLKELIQKFFNNNQGQIQHFQSLSQLNQFLAQNMLNKIQKKEIISNKSQKIGQLKIMKILEYENWINLPFSYHKQHFYFSMSNQDSYLKQHIKFCLKNDNKIALGFLRSQKNIHHYIIIQCKQGDIQSQAKNCIDYYFQNIEGKQIQELFNESSVERDKEYIIQFPSFSQSIVIPLQSNENIVKNEKMNLSLKLALKYPQYLTGSRRPNNIKYKFSSNLILGVIRINKKNKIRGLYLTKINSQILSK